MATKDQLNTLGLAIDALAEKHDISKYAVRSILAELPDDILRGADWKDLDAMVQEGLVKPGYTDEEETKEIEYDPEWKYRAGYDYAAGYRD